MSNEAVKFTITEGRREAIDNLIRKEAKAKFGVWPGIDAPLDHRYTNREGNAEKKIAGWSGYERYLLGNGHTVYVGLTNPSEPSVSFSEKPDTRAQKKVEAKKKREAARAERKAVREVKAKAPKADKATRDGIAYNKAEMTERKSKGRSGVDAGEVARVQKEQKVGYKTAVTIVKQAKAIREADAVKA